MDADVVVVGAGIVGCSAAAFLAEAGAVVVVVDRAGVAAGASGRNSGVLQHPLDAAHTEAFERSLALHREVLDLADEPDGILILGETSAAGIPVAAEVIDDAHDLEPVVRPGTPAVRVDTGWVIGPRTATEAWARRAQRGGARFVIGEDPPPATRTLIATGAWTRGVSPLWGVTAVCDRRSTHVLEEGGVNAVAASAAGGGVFSLVGDVLGSSFDRTEPDPGERIGPIAARARRFIGDVRVRTARACPRPATPDGRVIAERRDETTWVCAGHGAWGISLGPATARQVVDEIVAAG